MKKVVLLISLVALVSLGLVSISFFPGKVPLPGMLQSNIPHTTDYTTKYSDCIDLLDLATFSKDSLHHTAMDQTLVLEELNSSLHKYQQSLDSAIKNLNALDAHQFLHAEFKRCKEAIQSDSLSAIKTYYILGTMQICYDLDTSLNLDSDGLVKNEK